MENRVEDYLLDLKNTCNLPMTYEVIDALIQDFIRIARNVY
jgi:hypothetical protein